MYSFYANAPPRAHPSHYQSPPANAIQYTYLPPPMSSNPSPSAFDKKIKERLVKADANLGHAISRLHLRPENERQLLGCLKYLRLYKHLFMHTYVHLLSCCKSRNLDWLLKYATDWKEWNSVKQLACNSLIRDPLLELWKGCDCDQHKHLLAQRFVIDHDNSDLLCLLLYCSRGPALYELHNNQAVGARHGNLKESEHVIELLWKFLMQYRGDEDDTRRLRACIYRMARKYAYLPHGLQIKEPCIPNRQSLGPSAHGILTGARMQGRDVVIKRIVCDDRASKRKCLEMFASEAILWGTLQHKNIVPFIGVIEEGLNMGLISPFFENGDVRSYMKKQDPRHLLALAGRLGKGLAEALEYIHSHEPPIIHGDIKADNVLVNDKGDACLGDFGQSHASDSRKYLDSTRVGLAACPYRWMAPELMKDECMKCSDKSDMYSFGCVLYEMVSGEIPFQRLSNDSQVMRCVCSGERPNRPGSISRDHLLWRVVDDCWKSRPEDRPSATKLVRLLK